MLPEAASTDEVARSLVFGQAGGESSCGGMMDKGVARQRLLLLLLLGWVGGEHGLQGLIGKVWKRARGRETGRKEG